MQPNEHHIIEEILSGNTEKYNHIIKRYGRGIMTFVCRMIPQHEDAEDVVQDTFINAFHSLPTYDPAKASLATWLNRIAYYTTIKHIKSQGPQHISIGDEWTSQKQIAQDAIDELMNDESEDIVDLLYEALQQLTAEERILIHLFYFDQQPLRDIAYTLNCEAGTLATRLHRIRKKLYIITKLSQVNDYSSRCV